MGQGYQDRDAEIIDYQLWKEDGVGGVLRGPKPDNLIKDEYISCVGAAQTFGCYVKHTYVEQIGNSLGCGALNLGISGAGPGFFLSRPAFIKKVNQGKLAIVQVMSGRSVANSLYSTNGKEMLERISDGVKQGAAPMYAELLQSKNSELISAVLHETRNNWVREYIELLDRITVPKILLWFSVRTPEYSAELNNVHDFFGEFPQLVNREMINLIKVSADDYIECVTDAGMPQKLISQYTGQPVTINKRADLGGNKKSYNDYYPSPEMHDVAAKIILEKIKGKYFDTSGAADSKSSWITSLFK